jgi:hypothetical protein
MPDVLVKGGDYRVDNIAGAKEVIDNGGKVVLAELVEGISTTLIIERMKNRVNSLEDRFTALKLFDVTSLIKELSEWITLYNDVLEIKGEAIARKKLTEILNEKAKTWEK